jgi:hypothetical protein
MDRYNQCMLKVTSAFSLRPRHIPEQKGADFVPQGVRAWEANETRPRHLGCAGSVGHR